MRIFLPSHVARTALLAGAISLGACGGGGSDGDGGTDPGASPSTPSTLSGTAASGAPVSGSVVAIDATGRVSPAATTSATGAFTLDISGMTAPFLLQVVGTASGHQVYLSSVATAAGQTVNLTPLTDLIVSAAANAHGGSSLTDACATSSTTVAPVCLAALTAATSGTRLADAAASVRSMVAPIDAAGTDPLNGSFVADGTGFDAVLDRLLVTPATSAAPMATVTLIATGTPLGSVAVTGGSGVATATVSTPGSDALVVANAAASVLPQVKTCMASLSALYANGVPTTAQVLPYLDAGMQWGGTQTDWAEFLSSGEAPAVRGVQFTANSLATQVLDRLSTSEMAALDAGTGSIDVLRARPYSGGPVGFDGSGNPVSAWMRLNMGNDGEMTKFVKGAAYDGCPGGWKIAGPQRIDLHMAARVVRSGSNFQRERAMHINVEDVDDYTRATGLPTVDTVSVHGPGLAFYSGDAGTPVGREQYVTLTRPTGLTPWFIVYGPGVRGTTEAVQSCQDVAASGTGVQGTPCVDESRVVPGAVYVFALMSEGRTVAAFPYQIAAVPLSRAFAQANQAQLFAALGSVTPSSAAAIRSAVQADTRSALDGLFSATYSVGAAYGAMGDNCNLRVTNGVNGSGQLLLVAEMPVFGQQTSCTFTSANVTSGSLARPANPADIAGASLSIALSALGNQLIAYYPLP